MDVGKSETCGCEWMRGKHGVSVIWGVAYFAAAWAKPAETRNCMLPGLRALAAMCCNGGSSPQYETLSSMCSDVLKDKKRHLQGMRIRLDNLQRTQRCVASAQQHGTPMYNCVSNQTLSGMAMAMAWAPGSARPR